MDSYEAQARRCTSGCGERALGGDGLAKVVGIGGGIGHDDVGRYSNPWDVRGRPANH